MRKDRDTHGFDLPCSFSLETWNVKQQKRLLVAVERSKDRAVATDLGGNYATRSRAQPFLRFHRYYNDYQLKYAIIPNITCSVA